jgi:antirestriction protein ArdC
MAPVSCRDSIYSIVTERVLSSLSAGRAPWERAFSLSQLPINGAKLEQPYQGFNVYSLAAAGARSPFWFTHRQITDLGGTLEPGTPGTPLITWMPKPSQPFSEDKPAPWITESTKEAARQYTEMMTKDNEVRQRRKKHVLNQSRYVTVYPADAVTGLKVNFDLFPKPLEHAKEFDHPACRAAEMALEFGCPCPITRLKGTLADTAGLRVDMPDGLHGYSSLNDTIYVSNKENFTDPYRYYHGIFHNLIHASGAHQRCHRPSYGGYHFHPKARVQEELVAEIGAAWLCSKCGLAPKESETRPPWKNQGHLNVLREDPLVLVNSAQHAKKAVGYVREFIILNAMHQGISLNNTPLVRIVGTHVPTMNAFTPPDRMEMRRQAAELECLSARTHQYEFSFGAA